MFPNPLSSDLDAKRIDLWVCIILVALLHLGVLRVFESLFITKPSLLPLGAITWVTLIEPTPAAKPNTNSTQRLPNQSTPSRAQQPEPAPETTSINAPHHLVRNHDKTGSKHTRTADTPTHATHPVLISAPSPKASNPCPVYPELPRQLGWEGKVILKVNVSAQGAVDRLLVQRRSGYVELDQAAVAAVKHWRFSPALRGLVPVPSKIVIPILFLMHRDSSTDPQTDWACGQSQTNEDTSR